MKTLEVFFKKNNFKIENRDKHHYDFLATKKGSNMFIMKYTDYFYVKKVNTSITLNDIEIFHSASKKHANSSYKLPKVFRLNIPNINSVLITDHSLDETITDYISNLNRSIVGGEQDSIFIIDKSSNSLYSSGKELTTISGEAKLIWGNKKEFKTLNGRNRTYYLMQKFISKL